MNLADETDETLGLRVAKDAPQDRAHAPYQELYRRHTAMITRFIADRMVPPQVDDVHQKVWTKAWDHAIQFTIGTGYRAWLLRIARNTITDEYRAVARRPVQSLVDDAEVAQRGRSVEESLIAKEQSVALSECLRKLDSKALELVQGRLSGKSYAELCKGLGLTEAAAHKMFFKSKAQLQQCVEQKMS